MADFYEGLRGQEALATILAYAESVTGLKIQEAFEKAVGGDLVCELAYAYDWAAAKDAVDAAKANLDKYKAELAKFKPSPLIQG